MYEVTITTKTDQIKFQIEELKLLKELLLQFQNEPIEIELHERDNAYDSTIHR